VSSRTRKRGTEQKGVRRRHEPGIERRIDDAEHCGTRLAMMEVFRMESDAQRALLLDAAPDQVLEHRRPDRAQHTTTVAVRRNVDPSAPDKIVDGSMRCRIAEVEIAHRRHGTGRGKPARRSDADRVKPCIVQDAKAVPQPVKR
jgi:hypothetical protein